MGTSYQDIEVRADAMNLFIAAFELFPSIAHKYLHKRGLATVSTTSGKLQLEKSFIQLDVWLNIFEAVLNDIGPSALFRIGQHGVKNPNFPPSVKDIDSALREIDIAYHMSHRKGGVSMLDRMTGKMLEGIGHYAVIRESTQKRIELHSDTPYPCPAEHGLVSGIAALFEPRSVVVHAPGRCRLAGGARCVYVVSW
jgi:hypothetical protein